MDDTGHHGLVGDSLFHGFHLDGRDIPLRQTDIYPTVFTKGSPGNFLVFFFSGFQVVHRKPFSVLNRFKDIPFFFIKPDLRHFCHLSAGDNSF